ncbi:MAG: cellulose biosynthesis protein BcsQ [Methylococcaceae bacterium]|nr:cellulose biosynthesis protein BcsQ [Methylococcaceae bacterium]
MYIVALVSTQGGVGKTTITANLAAAIGKRGHAVLALDWDPANRLGLHLGLDQAPLQGLAQQSVSGGHWNEAAYHNSDNVDFLPFGQLCEESRLAFERLLCGDKLWLARRLEELEYPRNGVVLVDTMRAPSPYLTQALQVADRVLSVMTPAPTFQLDIEAMEKFLIELGEGHSLLLRQNYLLNQVDTTRRLTREIITVLHAQLEQRLLRYMIHRDEAVPEAIACNASVADHAPLGQADHDFQGLASWLLAQADGEGPLP